MHASRRLPLVVLLALPAAAGAQQSLNPSYTLNVRGEALAAMPDLNADGVEELLVGIPSSNRVQLRSGADGTLIQTIAPSPFGTPLNAFGRAVVYAGTLGGKHRIAIGDPGAAAVGRVHLYEEDASGVFQSIAVFGPSLPGLPRMDFGWSLAAADLGQSGPAFELIVGAPGWRTSGTSRFGMFEVWDVSTLSTPFAVGAVTGGQDDELGFSVAACGSFESSPPDLAAEIAVGAPQTVLGATQGYVAVYNGATLTQIGNNLTVGPGDLDVGYSVAGLGTTSADAAGAFVVGMPNLADDFVSIVAVYEAAAGGLPTPQAGSLESSPNDDERGTSVASAGDYDLDGFDDYIAGAPGEPGAGVAGEAFVVDGADGTEHLRFTTPGATLRFGASVSALSRAFGTTTPLLVVADPSTDSVYVF
ncbi:MAG: integrin alpha [Planctomycetota bacterium]